MLCDFSSVLKKTNEIKQPPICIEDIDAEDKQLSAEEGLAIDNHIKRLRKKFGNRQQGSSTRYGRGLFYEQPKHTISTVIQKIKNIFKG